MSSPFLFICHKARTIPPRAPRTCVNNHACLFALDIRKGFEIPLVCYCKVISGNLTPHQRLIGAISVSFTGDSCCVIFFYFCILFFFASWNPPGFLPRAFLFILQRRKITTSSLFSNSSVYMRLLCVVNIPWLDIFSCVFFKIEEKAIYLKPLEPNCAWMTNSKR